MRSKDCTPSTARKPSPPQPLPELAYRTGKPSANGIYACRVPIFTNDGRPISRIARSDGESRAEHLCEDLFLQWHDGMWHHYGSSERYRLDVPYFMGPLPRVNA